MILIRILLVILSLCIVDRVVAQIRGVVYDSAREKPLAHVSIELLKSSIRTVTGTDGQFSLTPKVFPDTLLVSRVGYRPERRIIFKDFTELKVYLHAVDIDIEEVQVSSGYQYIPKDRATGSYTFISERNLERGISADILGRLEGITNGLAFEISSSSSRGEVSSGVDLRVRGVSTIRGEGSPLIVLDNFPYEGDINNINPNDVMNITVLKDAAATSIWGARAANGVIVIQTKNGVRFQSTTFDFSANTSMFSKPDLFYSRIFLNSNDAIELEKTLFEMGRYIRNDWTAVPPAVEILFALEEGRITAEEANHQLEELKLYDVRKDAQKYLYRIAENNQYALSARGGGTNYSYLVSVGYDMNKGALIGNNSNRLTINNKMEFQPFRNIRIGTNINYINSVGQNNGLGLSDLSPARMTDTYTYARLIDENTKEYLPVVKNNSMKYTDKAVQNGLLDWHFRPLEELELADNTFVSNETRVNSYIHYKPIEGLSAEIRYQFQNLGGSSRNHYAKETYLARNLINQYTQEDGSHIVPVGGVLDYSSHRFQSHYGRVQFDYSKELFLSHRINTIVGFETRQEQNINYGIGRLYGYDDAVLTHVSRIDFSNPHQTRPNQVSSILQSGNSAGRHITDRFVSYYSNIGYDYDGKYMLSSSVRWDASNIFGVDFNQKGVPLWSSGAAWNISKESFFSVAFINNLKLRTTFGSNGNTVRSLSSLPYISYGFSNSITGLPMSILGSVGNPDLGWERVNTLNIGMEAAFFNNRFSIDFDIYNKDATNLIGEDIFDPTVGIIPTTIGYNLDNKRNYASLNTKGMDFEINIINLDKKFRWETNLLFSIVRNKVINFNGMKNPRGIDMFGSVSSIPLLVGMPMDQVYAVPWYGLDKDTGAPLVMVDGELGVDYTSYFNDLKIEDLIKVGVRMPTHFGSFRNILRMGNVTLDANIAMRFGHVVRRESINYVNLFGNAKTTNVEYNDRWQQSGDELITNVPSMPVSSNSRRDQAYNYSEVVVEKGDHIRFQDLSVSYTLPEKWTKTINVQKLHLMAYVKNIGIIWKESTFNFDPDVRALYPRPLQVSIGVKLNM